MAAKLKFITDLYGETLTEISNSPIDWMRFLKTASNNYKYSFNDQVLIYAQRPEAKACAGIDTWNRNVGRWQVSGRSDLSFQERLELEQFYSNQTSLKLDIKIFFKTFAVVLLKKGAK